MRPSDFHVLLASSSGLPLLAVTALASGRDVDLPGYWVALGVHAGDKHPVGHVDSSP